MSEGFVVLKTRFKELKLGIPVLQAALKNVADSLSGDKLVDRESVDHLQTLLSKYRESVDGLCAASEQMSISIALTMTQIEAQIQEAEKRQREYLREMRNLYLRLTTESEKVQNRLEETKRALVERCRTAGDDLAEVLQPYVSVVKKAQNPDEHLTEDEFELIYENVSHTVALAAERGRLSVSQDADISRYLDETPEEKACPQREQAEEVQPSRAGVAGLQKTEPAVQERDQAGVTGEQEAARNDAADAAEGKTGEAPEERTQEGQVAADAELSAEPVNGDAEIESEQSGAADDGQAENDEVFLLGDDYKDLMEPEIQFSFSEDTPASTLSSKKFEKILKKYPRIASVLMLFGKEKIVSTGTNTGERTHEILPTIQCMENNGLLIKIECSEGENSLHFWSLSSKGWACFSKKEVADHLRRIFRNYEIPSKDLVLSWNRLSIFRAMELSCYMTRIKHPFSVYRNNTIVYAQSDQAGEKAYVYGYFTKDNREIEELYQFIRNFPKENFIIIVVSTVSDAEKLKYALSCIHDRMGNTDDAFEKVCYVLYDKPEEFFGNERANRISSAELNVIRASDDGHEHSEDDSPEDDRAVRIYDEMQESENPDADGVEQYLDEAFEMLLSGRTDAAAVMIKYLAQKKPELQTLAEQFACATGDPSMGGTPGSKVLQTVFSAPAGTDPVADTLAAAAYLRMYFSFAAGEQTYLSRDMSHQKDSLAFVRYPEIRDILYNLADFVKYQQRGLDDELISIVLRNYDVGMLQSDLKKRAEEMLNSRLTESSHGNKIIKRTRKLLFDSDGDITRILTAIRDNVKSEKASAESFMQMETEKLIDDTWREACIQLNASTNDGCKYVERVTLTRQLNSIRDLAGDWLRVNARDERVDNEQAKAAGVLIEKIRQLMSDALARIEKDTALPLEQRAAGRVLVNTIHDCAARLSGDFTEEDLRYNYYIDLLRAPYVALDDLNHPHIESPEEEGPEFYFCQRAMQYRYEPETTWEEVLERIFSGKGVERVGMDYGCARVIKKYLYHFELQSAWKDEYDIEAAVREATDRKSIKRNSVELWEQDFAARLEMADGDNWFNADPNLRGYINRAREKLKDVYYYSENFGFYGRGMNALFGMLQDKAETLKPRYEKEYDKLVEGRSEEELSLPIFSQILEMIEKRRFGAAESFMQQVRNGNLSIGNGELSSGTLNDFLDKVNSTLYQLSRLDKNKSLASVYMGMHRQLTNNTLRSGYGFLNAWPNSGVGQPNKIRAMFEEMDFEVDGVTGGNTEYAVTLRDKGVVVDYPHPIATFGSIMDKNGIDVVIINGVRGADGLFTEIDKRLNKNRGNRPLLLLVNSAITVADRRKLAKSMNRMTSNKQFLLMDRCLALYLADAPKTDRFKTLLRCALPFRVINPYFENSALPIPPDMFIGRREEIQKIVAPDGPNLLYGGRQLGKTAILRRIEYQRNRPESGEWASYVDIRDMNHVEAVEIIAKALRRNSFLPEDKKPETWKELIDAIESQLMDSLENRNHSLLLMMDESDHVLKLFEEEDFRTLGEMKRLQQTTDGRFKFILAGLHNVLRFSSNEKALGGNSVLPHLGGITIQPMKFSEGRELLEVPLSYLGFTIDQGQEDIIAQILHSTNYYPGLIHFYASRLVEHMKEISSEVNTPPYKLSRDVLLRMIGDESFRQQRTEKLMMTLRVDEREQDAYYYTLAYALAMYSYENEDVLLHGASAQEIKALCVRESAGCRIGKLTDRQVEVLLDELVTLNILRQEDERDGKRCFKFSRVSFLEMLGSEDDVILTFMETLEKEAAKA